MSSSRSYSIVPALKLDTDVKHEYASGSVLDSFSSNDDRRSSVNWSFVTDTSAQSEHSSIGSLQSFHRPATPSFGPSPGPSLDFSAIEDTSPFTPVHGDCQTFPFGAGMMSQLDTSLLNRPSQVGSDKDRYINPQIALTSVSNQAAEAMMPKASDFSYALNVMNTDYSSKVNSPYHEAGQYIGGVLTPPTSEHWITPTRVASPAPLMTATSNSSSQPWSQSSMFAGYGTDVDVSLTSTIVPSHTLLHTMTSEDALHSSPLRSALPHEQSRTLHRTASFQWDSRTQETSFALASSPPSAHLRTENTFIPNYPNPSRPLTFANASPLTHRRQPSGRRARKQKVRSAQSHRHSDPFTSTHPIPSKTLRSNTSTTSQNLRTKTRHACTHPTCTSVFDKIEHLKRHEFNHTGEKPYPCVYSEKCNKRFSRQDNKRDHYKTHLSVTRVGKNDRTLGFDEFYALIEAGEEPREARMCIAMLERWRAEGKHLKGQLGGDRSE